MMNYRIGSILSIVITMATLTTYAATNSNQGSGANQCVRTSHQDNNIIFTNACSQAITIVIANQRGPYLPGLLKEGENQTHSADFGPYRYFACEGGYIPRDPNGGYPKYNSAEYECSAN